MIHGKRRRGILGIALRALFWLWSQQQVLAIPLMPETPWVLGDYGWPPSGWDLDFHVQRVDMSHKFWVLVGVVTVDNSCGWTSCLIDWKLMNWLVDIKCSLTDDLRYILSFKTIITSVSRWIAVFLCFYFDSVSFSHLLRSGSGVFFLITLTPPPPKWPQFIIEYRCQIPAAFRADLQSLWVCFILLAFRELSPGQLFHVTRIRDHFVLGEICRISLIRSSL